MTLSVLGWFVLQDSLTWTTGAVAVFRQQAHRLDPAKEAAHGFRLSPMYECFYDDADLSVDAVRTAGDCSELCSSKGCVAYNHYLEAWRCELFFKRPKGHILEYDKGCTSASLVDIPDASGPNVVFLVVESTDGRTWTPGYQSDVIPMPNLRKLQQQGTTFLRHYANTPVCCPSRATFWSGRHAHKLPHESALGELIVEGVWNNFEGLSPNFTNRLDQVLHHEAGYHVLVSGKTDWVTGGHSESARLDAFTKYVDFPYDINATGGFFTEKPWELCASNGSVQATGSAHEEDWNVTRQAVSWGMTAQAPWFLYTGHKIVHPPYATSQYWDAKIDRAKIDVPKWPPVRELHPCDFESTMRKGCMPSEVNASAFYSLHRRREIRAKYYAMIAEFDAMVGMYVDAFYNSAVFIVTSDHGDMQMEHQQFYKMSPYDASARVPMIIHDPHRPSQPKYVAKPTQLIDIFPTILDLIGLPATKRKIDGTSLLPLLDVDDTSWTRDAIMSQFHGDDNGMSWFALVANLSGTTHKLVVWGTGDQHPNLLFDLDADPDEASPVVNNTLESLLLNKLRGLINFPAVAKDVALYGRLSLQRWIQLQGNQWQSSIHAPGLRWDIPFDRDANASFRAIDQFLSNPNLEYIRPCRRALTKSGESPVRSGKAAA